MWLPGKRVIQIFFAVSALIFLLTNSSVAEIAQVNVPFLFTEDEKLEQTELTAAVSKSERIESSEYLNAPLTRLEYILTKLDERLKRGIEDGILRQGIADGFMPRPKNNYGSEVSLRSFVRYSREVGRIIVGYRVEGLGRPKRPMRTTCEEALLAVSILAPQQNVGYLYHNTVLGVLAQEDLDKYTPALEVVARTIIHKVILESMDDASRSTHAFICQRTEKDAPVRYERHSFKSP